MPKTHQPKTKVTLLLFIIGLFIGLFFSAQVQAEPTRVTNPTLPLDSLTETHQNLLNEQSALQKEYNQIKISTDTLEKSNQITSKISDTLKTQLANAKKNSGLTEITGPGLEIILGDSPHPISSEQLIRAGDLRDIINALLIADAKELAINNERLVETTSIDAVSDTVIINNTRLNTPFHIFALGDPVALKSSLIKQHTIPDLEKRQKDFNIQLSIITRQDLTIPAFSGNLSPHFLSTEITQ